MSPSKVAAYRTQSINDSKARMKMPIEGKCMHARHRRQNRAAQLVRFSVLTPPRLGGRASRSTVERPDCSRLVWNSSACLPFDSQSLAAGSDRALRHTLVLIETFVQTPRYTSAVQKAAGCNLSHPPKDEGATTDKSSTRAQETFAASEGIGNEP